MRESKTALIHRLRAMNDQMSVMDEMSRNIESEFHHSKMVSRTLAVLYIVSIHVDHPVISTGFTFHLLISTDFSLSPSHQCRFYPFTLTHINTDFNLSPSLTSIHNLTFHPLIAPNTSSICHDAYKSPSCRG